MKLKLRTSGDIQILTVAGLDTPENLQIIRAGVAKVLKSGKNKIIIELTEPGTIPAEVLRELAKFKLLANELSGDVVLSGLDQQLRQNVEAFAKPPFSSSFEKTEDAIGHFAAKPSQVPAKKDAASEASLEKERVRAQEAGEIGSVRKELEKLRKENAALTQMLARKLFQLKEPRDTQGYLAKIKDLENQLAEILAKPPSSSPS